MARPRAFNENEVSEAILQAFWGRGYGATSIAYLSEVTGLLPGSLYAAFGSKERMFQLAFERYMALLAEAITTDYRGSDAIEYIFRTIVEMTLDDSDRRGCLLINAIPEAKALPSDLQAELRRGLESMRGILVGHINEIELEPDAEPEALVSLLLAAAISIRVFGRSGFPAQTLHEVADGAITAVRHCQLRNNC
ncbi:MAG: hypothetical protein COB51_09040 [Moraxellaceae bacterium]|nr:MAG: hypothetical protein COB51_09040 [Moraxellaceae bacterium]